MKTNYLLIISLIILSGVYLGLILFQDPQFQNAIIVSSSPPNIIIIHAIEPDIPASIPLLKGTYNQGDKLDIENGDLTAPKNNVTSEQEAPIVAQRILSQYGGLPTDAKMSGVYTNYYKEIFPENNTVFRSSPTDTTIFYQREINGSPVLGNSDEIIISLGSNGELLEYSKFWRTLDNSGKNITIITPSEATEKIRNLDLVNRPREIIPATMDRITLGYYEVSKKEPEIYLEPVWIFTGKTLFNTPAALVVSARKFSNFTAIPISAATPLKIKFSDTSDASPIKWYWEFGDGTSSTEQNPVHTYRNIGKYSVSLTSWNDIGSDKKIQTIQIDPLQPYIDDSTRTQTPPIYPSPNRDEQHEEVKQ